MQNNNSPSGQSSAPEDRRNQNTQNNNSAEQTDVLFGKIDEHSQGQVGNVNSQEFPNDSSNQNVYHNHADQDLSSLNDLFKDVISVEDGADFTDDSVKIEIPVIDSFHTGLIITPFNVSLGGSEGHYKIPEGASQNPNQPNFNAHYVDSNTSTNENIPSNEGEHEGDGGGENDDGSDEGHDDDGGNHGDDGDGDNGGNDDGSSNGDGEGSDNNDDENCENDEVHNQNDDGHGGGDSGHSGGEGADGTNNDGSINVPLPINPYPNFPEVGPCDADHPYWIGGSADSSHLTIQGSSESLALVSGGIKASVGNFGNDDEGGFNCGIEKNANQGSSDQRPPRPEVQDVPRQEVVTTDVVLPNPPYPNFPEVGPNDSEHPFWIGGVADQGSNDQRPPRPEVQDVSQQEVVTTDVVLPNPPYPNFPEVGPNDSVHPFWIGGVADQGSNDQRPPRPEVQDASQQEVVTTDVVLPNPPYPNFPEVGPNDSEHPFWIGGVADQGSSDQRPPRPEVQDVPQQEVVMTDVVLPNHPYPDFPEVGPNDSEHPFWIGDDSVGKDRHDVSIDTSLPVVIDNFKDFSNVYANQDLSSNQNFVPNSEPIFTTNGGYPFIEPQQGSEELNYAPMNGSADFDPRHAGLKFSDSDEGTLFVHEKNVDLKNLVENFKGYDEIKLSDTAMQRLTVSSGSIESFTGGHVLTITGNANDQVKLEGIWSEAGHVTGVSGDFTLFKSGGDVLAIQQHIVDNGGIIK